MSRAMPNVANTRYGRLKFEESKIYRCSYFVRHSGKVKSNSSSARSGPLPLVIYSVPFMALGIDCRLARTAYSIASYKRPMLLVGTLPRVYYVFSINLTSIIIACSLSIYGQNSLLLLNISLFC